MNLRPRTRVRQPAAAPPPNATVAAPAVANLQARAQQAPRQQTRRPPPPAAQPPNVVPPVFALTPYQAVRGIINYGTPEGRKYFERATAPLSETKFDCQSDGLRSFLEDVDRRAGAFAWDTGILDIPTDVADPDTSYKYLVDQYGEIDMQTIKDFDNTFIHHQTREAQDSMMLYECLMNSLCKEAKDTITTSKEMYFIGDKPSGSSLLKLIIQESHIDTNATTDNIRKKLSSLDAYMPTIDHNIRTFNTYVKNLVKALAARGETTTDLLTNLFKAYLAVPDKQFKAYINGKLERHEEGLTITPLQLMDWAKMRYDILFEKKEWNAPTEEEKQILALQAQVNNLKKGKGNQKGKNGNRNNNGNNSNGDAKISKPQWMSQEPAKDQLTKPKTWMNELWYWCGKKTGGKCEKFRKHKPSECGGRSYFYKKRQAGNQESNQDKREIPRKPPTKRPKAEEKEKKKTIKFSKALEAISETNEIEDDGDAISI